MGNIANVKQAYTTNEWTARENYYITEVAKLNIPTNPSTKDVMQLISEVDSLMLEALLDAMYIKRKFEDLNTKMKLSEKQLFTTLKLNPPAAAVRLKLTEAEVTGLVVDYLKNNPIDGMSHDIYTLVAGVSYRKYFMDSVVDMLKDKKMSVFADKAMMQIEAGIDPNVANNNTAA